MLNPTQFLREILEMKINDSLGTIKSYTDELGSNHKKFQQYYKGIKVENATYLIHGKGKSIETINGEFAVVSIPSVIPAITEAQALTKVLKYVSTLSKLNRIKDVKTVCQEKLKK